MRLPYTSYKKQKFQVIAQINPMDLYDILSPPSLLLALGGIFVIWRLHLHVQDRRDNPNRLPLPPGPKGYPIIGSLLAYPTSHPWITYDKWCKKYGDMVYFEVTGQRFLVLGTREATYELFEKRSSNYSDRVRMPMLVEMSHWKFNFAFIRYGDWWRRHRRCFHDYFHPNIVHAFHPIHISASRAFIRRLLDSPEQYKDHIRLSFAATVMKSAYGITVNNRDEHYVQNVEEALGALAKAGTPGSFLVDFIPVMKYIPSWFPGAGWKRQAERWSRATDLAINKPFNQVEEEVQRGIARPSIAASLIDKFPDKEAPNRAEEETIARNVCGVSYVAGADTTLSTTEIFFMAMALYPEVQKKAQAELDVVLEGRLPEFSDRPNLPYLNALIKEALRWQLVGPIGIPHMCTASDEYNGYYIPKGTIVIGNSWAILHDPEVYPDPFTFNPDRFLKNGKLNPEVPDSVTAFGYGRCICPGRFFANDSLFAIISHILSVFDIRPGLDKDGNEVVNVPEMTGGLLSYPANLQCRITTRSKTAQKIIRNSDLMEWI